MHHDYFDKLIQFAHTNTILFVAIVIGTLFVVFILTALIMGPKQPKKSASVKKPIANKNHHVVTTQDIRAIAGDDMLVTQLDLARAYIELGKITLATKILKNVVTQGNVNQKQAAQELLSIL